VTISYHNGNAYVFAVDDKEEKFIGYVKNISPGGAIADDMQLVRSDSVGVVLFGKAKDAANAGEITNGEAWFKANTGAGVIEAEKPQEGCTVNQAMQQTIPGYRGDQRTATGQAKVMVYTAAAFYTIATGMAQPSNAGRAGAIFNSGNLIGRSYGPAGTVVANPRLNIMGADPYAIGRMAERGLSPATAQFIVRQPTVVLSQAGGKHLFISPNGAVVLDNRQFIVTVYSKADFDAGILQILRDAGGTP
jgi:hypothetical protein